MRTGRRGFFGLVGGAAVAGPSLIKDMAEKTSQAVTREASLADSGVPVLKSTDPFEPCPDIPEIFSGHAGRRLFVSQFGIPEFVQRQWEERAEAILSANRLDTDLMANRSMSRAGRIMEQKRRCVAAQRDEWLNGSPEHWVVLRKKMEKKFPWIKRF